MKGIKDKVFESKRLQSLVLAAGLLLVVAFRYVDAPPGRAAGPIKPKPYRLKLPAHIARFKPQIPTRNPLTEEGVALGEALFFDAKLSRTGEQNCAGCHRPRWAFATQNRIDAGVFGEAKMGVRNSPSVMYSAWGNRFFWDGGANNLESQALKPLTDSAEMAAELPTVLRYLNSSPDYRKQFRAAFGIDTISIPYLLRALAQYERTLFDFASKWDEVQLGKAKFTALELKGETVFKKKCASCHPAPFFTDNQFHNKGLQIEYDSISNQGKGAGRYRITRRPADLGAYKTPTLRNVAFTYPYGHDGSIPTLQALLDRMDGHLNQDRYLDPKLKGLKISKEEKNSLVAFLNCLSD